jgi:protocatechuate 3,4-dioxygenase beta subunit
LSQSDRPLIHNLEFAVSSSPLNCWLPRYSCRQTRRIRRSVLPASLKRNLRVEKLEPREVPAVFTPSDISGRVYVDCNVNGVFDAGDDPIAGVTITLTGTDIFNHAVTSVVTTGTDGTYAFNKLEPGKYTIAETQPAAFFDGPDQLGFVVGAPVVNNGTAGNDLFSNIILDGGDSHGREYNFGEYDHNSLAGTVFLDLNDNGIQDTGESGIPGAKLVLVGTNDLGQPINQTVFSGGDGSYSFQDLRPGNYSITETTPDGFVDGTDTVGKTNGQTNGQLDGSDHIVNISLDGCHSGVGYNFGEKKTPDNSVSGFVFEDCNNNGVFDPGEEPISGVVVSIDGILANGQDFGVAAVTTDATGFYQFKNLPAGTYNVNEAQPSGFLDGKDSLGTPFTAVLENDRFSKIIIPAGLSQQGVNYNFGEVGNSISGIIYEDTNDNGVRDPGEPLITVPVTVTLTGTDDLGAAVSRTIVTSTGQYIFEQLRPGTYALHETTPAGYDDGKDTVGQTNGFTNGQLSGTDDIVNIALDGCNAGTGYNFGEKKQQNSDISGFVYTDCNNNGLREAGEEPIAGVRIILTGTDTTGASVSLTTTTDLAGFYIFKGLRTGTYTLTEDLVESTLGLFDGKDTLGTPFPGTVGDDTMTVTISSPNTHGTEYNFGELTPSNLAGVVFFDQNENGLQDNGEVGIGGVVLYLAGTNDLGQTVFTSTTSSADGSYAFGQLRPGDYRIIEVQPPDFVSTINTAGKINGVTTGTVTGDVITNIHVLGCESGAGFNFGEKKCPPNEVLNTISGFVFEDCNADGVFQPASEEGLPNVIVVLTGVDSTGAQVSIRTATDSSGFYQFVNLRAGTYTLTEQQPADHLDGQDSAGTPFGGIASKTIGQDVISAIVIPTSTSSQSGVNYNFGEVGTSISGVIYEDTNDNGVQDPGEALITAPVTVTLTGTDDTGAIITRSIVTTTGQYQFDLLRPGKYSLTETTPAGYEDGKDTVGQTDGTTNGQLSGTDSIVNITRDGCHAGTGYNFGEKKISALNTISGFVFQDCNANGVYDPATEEGIANVTVVLTGSDITGAPVNLTTTTNASGQYQFTGLKAGTYSLSEVQPSAFLDGKDSAGTPFGGTASVAIGQDLISNIVIPSSQTPQNGVNYNFGEVGASIAGVIYMDENNNGVFDAGETLITVPVTITLTGTDDTGAPVTRSIVTTTGQYLFEKLRPGNYSLSESQPAGFPDGIDTPGTPFGGTSQEPDRLVNISVDGCHAGTGYNFGEGCPPSSLSGFVYLDTGTGKVGSPGYNDGIRADTEIQLSNVTVTLTGTDDQGNAVSISTLTGQIVGKGNGYYQFTNLRPGNYTISETQPFGLPDGKDTPGTPTGSNANTNDKIANIQLPCDFNGVNNNFGELGNQSPPGKAEIHGIVYVDNNCNGLQDSNDIGRIAGVTITLFNSDTGASLAHTTTNSKGEYEFLNLTDGNYTVVETQPPLFLDGGENVGTPFGGNNSVNDTISNIQIPVIPDDTTLVGINYNFGECSNSTKKRFLASSQV